MSTSKSSDLTVTYVGETRINNVVYQKQKIKDFYDNRFYLMFQVSFGEKDLQHWINAENDDHAQRLDRYLRNKHQT